ncbi:retrovirus-related pol polyprotein from transposon TNT 1-94 [Tanacetum coccineum]
MKHRNAFKADVPVWKRGGNGYALETFPSCFPNVRNVSYEFLVPPLPNDDVKMWDVGGDAFDSMEDVGFLEFVGEWHDIDFLDGHIVHQGAHRILHNLFKSSIQATVSGEATKSGDKLLTFNLHVKANDIKQNKTHLTCGNCGMSRHTTDQCFELIGYPDWWNDGHKKGNKNRGLERGKASAANTGTDRKNSTGLGGMAATTVNEEDGSFSMSTTQNYNINQKQSWIFDCGATDTMTYDLSDFATSTKPTKSYIHTANGEKINVRNGGTIEISPTLKLSNCLYVPALSHKLLSISHVTKELNCSVIMQPTFCILQDIRTGAIIGRGTERQGLYYVDELTTSGTVMLAHGTSEREAWLWHRRLGHPSGSYLHTLFPKLFPLNKPISCETCILAKSHRQTFKPSNTRVKVPFSLIHSDVWGPAPVIGGQSFRYYVIFVDDCTRMTWIYFLKNKAEVYDRFTAFYAMIQTQFQKSIQVVRSDNGGEYMNSQMNLFFQSKGIVHQTTCPHTPEQNGVAERKNRLLLEMTRALIIESNAPNFFWPEALATATYLINRLPTKILKMKTPLETLSEYHTLPQVLTLEPKVFGCTVFAHIPKSYRDKLDPCAEKCVFVGYGVNQKGYRCYNPKTRHMITTMNCDFLETKYFYSSQHSGQGERECIDTLSWLSYGTQTRRRRNMYTYESPSPQQPEDQRNDKEEITKLKKNLFTEFEMKDLGRLKYFLGIEVLRSKPGIFMYQKKYVLDLLAEIGTTRDHEKLYLEHGEKMLLKLCVEMISIRTWASLETQIG